MAAQIIAGTRHAWQAGHKGFHYLVNAPAAPNQSGQPNRRRIGFLRHSRAREPALEFQHNARHHSPWHERLHGGGLGGHLLPGGLSYAKADKKKPFVCFGSFQDYLGRNPNTGGIKTKNEWVHSTNWDCVILDEYHYGAWRENAKELFEAEDKDEVEFGEGEGIKDFDEEMMPITTDAYLYLSGTPFRAIASGEFIEEQIRESVRQ